ncbi:TPA: endonuclease domain-containing protein [Vibrio alginolyticus]|uniref:endonuclease domain-containing protein n=1 Tax=Vibrio alginolyticus TaxID=663 RepID=UPI0021D14F6B
MSALEKTLLFQIKAMGLALPEKEYRFHETRRWRFDFAYPEHQLAVEVEGGTWAGGRHTRGSGYEKDCEKYNEAALRGWSVLRFTGSMIKSGKAVETLKEALS